MPTKLTDQEEAFMERADIAFSQAAFALGKPPNLVTMSPNTFSLFDRAELIMAIEGNGSLTKNYAVFCLPAEHCGAGNAFMVLVQVSKSFNDKQMEFQFLPNADYLT